MVGSGRQRRRRGRSALRMREAAVMRHARTRLSEASNPTACESNPKLTTLQPHRKNDILAPHAPTCARA